MELLGLLDLPFRTVLEIGCGRGATGRMIKEQYPGTTYIGIEIDREAANEARKVLDHVVTCDVERFSLEDAGIPSQEIDLVIFADVLEHLYDPWKVLRSLHAHLRPDGAVVASIPNAQNVRLLQNLTNGFWTYGNQGLLDATHIRFFTLIEIGKMFTGSGYRIDQMVSSCDTDMPQGGIWPRDLRLGKMTLHDVTIEDVQQLFTFQYLVRARRSATNAQGERV
jgi:2-polyprenyl-3-methyl-5-hydroxy-6-metoxy-1,4-benzoquinol methylase